MKKITMMLTGLLLFSTQTVHAQNDEEKTAVAPLLATIQNTVEKITLTGIWAGYYEQFGRRWKMTMVLLKSKKEDLLQGSITDLLESMPQIGFMYSELVDMEYSNRQLTFTKDYQLYYEDRTIRNTRAALAGAAENIRYDLKLTELGRLEGTWQIPGTSASGKAVFKKITNSYIDSSVKTKANESAEKE